jgi:hypothetical protein
MSESALAFLPLWQRLLLCCSGPDGEELSLHGWLRGISDDYVTIHLLGQRLAALTLEEGQAVQVLVGRPDGLYIVPARVVHYAGRVGVVDVAVAGPVTRLQQRRSPRSPAAIKGGAAALLHASGVPMRFFPVHLIDLGAGGIQFLCEESLSGNDRVHLVIPLDGDVAVTPIATVLECRMYRDPARRTGTTDFLKLPGEAGRPATAYRVRAYFSRITDAERERIEEYVARTLEELHQNPARLS